MTENELLGETRRLLSRALRTLAVLPDPDAAVYGGVNYWPDPKPDGWLEEHQSKADKQDRQNLAAERSQPARFRPTTFDCDVYLEVLSWLRGRDEDAVKALVAYEMCHSLTWGRIAEVMRISESTLHRLVSSLVWQIAHAQERRISELVILRDAA